MSPVQGRSITGLESESAARTCLIAGPSVKHPREAPERKLSSFGFLRSRSETELADTGRTRTRTSTRMARRGNPVGGFIHSFIHSFNLLALAGQSGYSFSHSHDDAVLVVGV
jgi:hypothetical protein